MNNWSRSCKTCKFYVEKIPTNTEKNYTIVGRCRRNAPSAGEGYPAVFPDDWCGQYRIDENKV